MVEARAASTFGPYAVEARIGSGGMGVVYRGRHLVSGRAAAVKTVQVASPELVAGFRREVQVLAGLSHPGIVRILDEGLASGTPWYAMELVEGRPLSSLLHGSRASQTEVVVGSLERQADRLESNERPRQNIRHPEDESDERERPPLFDLLKVVRKVCVALSFVHSHGLVHRDLKPENILIEPNGNPVLVDFGVVGQFGDSAGREVLELTGSAGTLAYMAPEQGLGRLVDARADLFSLGCILYECIVGRPPFGASGLYDMSLEAPALPSTLAPGVSPELDRLVLGLLAKDLHERVGYADDVARALDRIIRDGGAGQEDVDSPSTSSAEPAYLYRPEFAGRKDVLERLNRLVRSAKHGSGCIALVGGESGLGKTRLLLELGARAVASGTNVITGECKPVGAVTQAGGARGQPLHPFRNFLLAVADACQAGGPEMTTRLLGRRGSVLAPYEPSLARVLGPDLPEPERESPERARARVFWALEGLLVAFTQEQPLLLLLDDLQWADSLSLEFLNLFASHEQARAGVSLVATFRSEETNDELLAFTQQPGVVSEHLERFDRAAVGDMVSGMLALRAPPSEWVAFLEEESGGNPFFIAEYLRAAIAERLLTRSSAGRWSLGAVEGSASLRDRLGLPATLGALIGRRLSGLDAEALQMVRAAAVLGREFDAELVAQTADVDVERVAATYARLRQRQILGEEGPSGSGFVHDKLREVAYGLIDGSERARLHRRAAEALARRRDLGGTAVDAAVLGYHQSQAGEHEQAALCFAQAAEAARRNHANRDALRYFRLALGELERAPRRSEADLRSLSARLRESLADVLFVFGEHEEARSALDLAIDETSPTDRVARARRRRLLARTWERLHQHERALALCALAEQDLGEPPADTQSAEDFWYEAVQIQIQTAWHLYFLSRVPELNTLIERVRPVIEARGTALQRAQFFQHLVHVTLREQRYRMTEDIIRYARLSLAAAEQADEPSELALARFSLAFVLTFNGLEIEAEPLFLAAISHVERVGDASLQARFISYYSIMLRRLRRVAQAESMAQRALDIAKKHGFYDYVGVAHANLCWVALQNGGDVEAAAASAMDAWSKLPAAYPYPLQWMVRAPLAAHLTRMGQLTEALAHWSLLLDKRQHLLPERLSDSIALALTEHDSALTLTHLTTIVRIAEELHYV
ncbi:MAG TPA: protein kinase [Polyangiaceae bacterium]